MTIFKQILNMGLNIAKSANLKFESYFWAIISEFKLGFQNPPQLISLKLKQRGIAQNTAEL